MNARKLAAACLIAGSAVVATGGVAAASDFTTQAWTVVGSYPNTNAGWTACWNAKANLPPSTRPDCKLDSESGQWVFLWKWES